MVSKEKEAIRGSEKTLSSSKQAWALQKEDYAFGKQWKADGKPIAWSCVAVPKDVFAACNVVAFYPEQFAALFSTRRIDGSRDPNVPTYAVKYCQIAESDGLPNYNCGYCRAATGYTIHGLRTGAWDEAPLGGPPLPDFLITTSVACDIKLKWFEYLARLLQKPLFTLDIPEVPHDLPASSLGVRAPILVPMAHLEKGKRLLSAAPADYEVDYLVSQYEDFFAFVDWATGQKYDPDRLNEALEWSYKSSQVNQEINELRKAVPAPMTCSDGFASSYPRLYLMSTKRGYEYFVALRDELKGRVEHGEAAVSNERFRLMWNGLPTWFNMGILNYFEKLGGVFVWEGSYNTGILPPRRPEDPIKELALRTQGAVGIGNRVASVVQEAREYKIDGVVISYLITCRPTVFLALELKKALEEELGIPTVNLESDLVDERVFAESQAFTRLDAFGEQLLNKGSVVYGGGLAGHQSG